MSATESTFKPALMLMSGRLAAFAVTFFSGPLLARIFTQSEFGTYKQFLLVVTTLWTIGQFGFAECLYYFIPGNPEASGRYAFNSLVMMGVLGCLFSLFVFTNDFRIAAWLNNPELGNYLFLAGVYLLFFLMGTLLEITLISRKQFRLATASYAISDVVRVSCLIVPALITHDLKWTFIGGITYFILRFMVMIALFYRSFAGGFRFDAPLLRAQWAYALPFATSGIFYTIQNYYHQFAVSYHFDAATFAIYSIGCLQIPLVDFMASPASNVMMVQMGESLRQGQFGRLLAIWHDTTRKLALLFFPLVACLIVNGYAFITFLYTTAYTASVPIFMLWSLTILFPVFQADGVLRVFAQNRWLMLTNGLRLVLVVSLMGWFLSSFNIIGPVFVTLAGAVFAKTMMLAKVKRLLRATTGNLFPWKDLGSIGLAAVLATIPPAILNAELNVPVHVLLPLSGMAYMITYGLLVLVLGLLNEAEKTALKRSLYVWNRGSRESRTEASL